MPDGFAFPINHRLWVPLHLNPEGYAPLDGPAIRVFGRLAPEATQAEANTEVVANTERTAAASPRTHEQLRPRVLAYGGESPGDRPLLEIIVRHLPVLLVLVVACANVGTLVYARTVTRGAEIAVRHALGASRGRILGQLFVEALVLASLSAVVGLTLAQVALKWGLAAFYGGDTGSLPFWMDPGLKLTTVVYAAVLTVLGAGILGVLPALKVAGPRIQEQLRNLGGGATLRFGKVWTSVMIGQVALTVIFLPPAMGISHEAVRDRLIRGPFPDEQFLAIEVDVDRDAASPLEATAREGGSSRRALLVATFERQLSSEPGVVAITFGDRLPGMGPGLAHGEFEGAQGQTPVRIPTLWTAAAGRGYFDAFGGAIVAGRDFHEGDRVSSARTVLVNEAFARRYFGGANPVGRRVRFGRTDDISAEPWFEIVGMTSDIGMTPTDLGEAPYVFTAASPATTSPLVMGVRTAGDPAALAPRARSLAAAIDPSLRVDQVHTLDELTWRQDVPAMVAAGAIAFVVALGLCVSAAGIFALMSVSVARRTREIGLRAALGATSTRVLAGVFSRALMLVGSGIAAGNGLLLLFIALDEEVDLEFAWPALLTTSIVLLAVGLLACLEPARRALRIQPMDALREQ